MPDQLRSMTFDVRGDFKLEANRQAWLNRLEDSLDKAVEQTNNSVAGGATLTERVGEHYDDFFKELTKLKTERGAAGALPRRLDELLRSLEDIISKAPRDPQGFLNSHRSNVLPVVQQSKDTIREEIDREPDEKQLRKLLSEKTQAVNEMMEREVKRNLAPHLSILANLQFEQGSLAVLGTVTLLSWAGTILIDATKEEAAKTLSELVKVAVRRSINYAFELITQPLSRILHLDMSVKAVDAETSALVARPETSRATTKPELQGTSTITNDTASSPASTKLDEVLRLSKFVVAGIGLLLVLVFLWGASSLFTIHLRTIPQAIVSPTAPPPTPSSRPSPT